MQFISQVNEMINLMSIEKFVKNNYICKIYKRDSQISVPKLSTKYNFVSKRWTNTRV